jgi:hypothetical protein
MKPPLFDKPFRVVTDNERYYAIVEIDETTARRSAVVSGDIVLQRELAEVVANALNLHAMPRLIQEARL